MKTTRPGIARKKSRGIEFAGSNHNRTSEFEDSSLTPYKNRSRGILENEMKKSFEGDKEDHFKDLYNSGRNMSTHKLAHQRKPNTPDYYRDKARLYIESV